MTKKKEECDVFMSEEVPDYIRDWHSKEHNRIDSQFRNNDDLGVFDKLVLGFAYASSLTIRTMIFAFMLLFVLSIIAIPFVPIILLLVLFI